jgi:outer membrane protein OmpA-like peptidoglycan-associated protein
MKKYFVIHVIVLLLFHMVSGQDTVHLMNPSFEDFPRNSRTVRMWKDCGFPGESPPDVQPFFASGDLTWGQKIQAIDGKTYLGMVVRDNDSYERVSQFVHGVLEVGRCYEFSIYLCKSNNYLSLSRVSRQIENYTRPAVVRIWGGFDYCSREELLGETQPIDNTDWRQFTFKFQPSQSYSYFMIEAFYKTPTLFPYNGNVLLDYASTINPIDCPEEDELFVLAEPRLPAPELLREVDEPGESGGLVRSTVTPPKPKIITKPKQTSDENVTKEQDQTTAEPKILHELNRQKLVKGQTIRIKKLFFEADTTTIDSSSFGVLDEIAFFLSDNPDVIVEIGGHTNGLPPNEYCDHLSSLRAESVANYLYQHGVSKSQVKSKGYGKRKPLASNNTAWGRQKNQRVEIRILNLQG